MPPRELSRDEQLQVIRYLKERHCTVPPEVAIAVLGMYVAVPATTAYRVARTLGGDISESTAQKLKRDYESGALDELVQFVESGDLGPLQAAIGVAAAERQAPFKPEPRPHRARLAGAAARRRGTFSLPSLLGVLQHERIILRADPVVAGMLWEHLGPEAQRVCDDAEAQYALLGAACERAVAATQQHVHERFPLVTAEEATALALSAFEWASGSHAATERPPYRITPVDANRSMLTMGNWAPLLTASLTRCREGQRLHRALLGELPATLAFQLLAGSRETTAAAFAAARDVLHPARVELRLARTHCSFA